MLVAANANGVLVHQNDVLMKLRHHLRSMAPKATHNCTESTPCLGFGNSSVCRTLAQPPRWGLCGAARGTQAVLDAGDTMLWKPFHVSAT